jgi:hypothetical protein
LQDVKTFQYHTFNDPSIVPLVQLTTGVKSGYMERFGMVLLPESNQRGRQTTKIGSHATHYIICLQRRESDPSEP